MTTISASSTVGIVLDSGLYANPISVVSGVTLSGRAGDVSRLNASGYGYALYAGSGVWTVTNAGEVAGSGPLGGGIRLSGGGTVANIQGGVIGTPGENAAAIYILGGAGSVVNGGTLNAGVWLQNGGAVTNQAGGLVTSASGTGGYGVGFNAGGTLYNAGQISGILGVDASNQGGVITNATGGVISGGYVGVLMGRTDAPSSGTRIVTNRIGATITGDAGLIASNDVVTVTNAGAIIGTQIKTIGVSPTITVVTGPGIALYSAGTIDNQAFGTISGTRYGIVAHASGVTILNSGQITGTGTANVRGVLLSAGGYVSNASHGTITSIGNGNAVRAENAAVTIVNAGHLLNNYLHRSAVALQAGGTVTNMTDALIQGGAWNGVYGTGGPIEVINDGAIAGSASSSTGSGVQIIGANATVMNQSDGVITGARFGVYISNGSATISNAGSIGGTSGAILLAAGQTNELIVSPGATFSGVADGGNPIGNGPVTTMELTSGATTGTIAGVGTAFVNFGSIVLDTGGRWFISGDTSGLAGTIAGFASGDTIELTGITATGSGFAGGVLTVDDAAGAATLNLPGAFTTSDFAVINVPGGVDVSLACFAAGTRIGTARGEVAVERLHVGDEIISPRGGDPRPVIWLGQRVVNCAAHPRPREVWPVRIRADAFGTGLPRRDLYLSPDHALFVGHCLIPVRRLIDGDLINQVPIDRVTYYHVELPRHDVLLAEGLPAESYLDTGDRANFVSSGATMRLLGDFGARGDPAWGWEAHACAPLVAAGPILDMVRAWLAAHRTASHRRVEAA
jgi:collagen type I alpha